MAAAHISRFSPLITDDPGVFIRELLLIVVNAFDTYEQSISGSLAFQRDSRLAIDVIQPILEQDQEFNKWLWNGYMVNRGTDAVPEIELNGDRNIVKEIVDSILDTQESVKEFHESIKKSENLGRFSLDNIKEQTKRFLRSSEIVSTIESNRERIAQLTEQLTTRKTIGALVKPTVEQYKKELPPQAYQFWSRHVGLDISTEWDKFAQAYKALNGKFHEIDLCQIKEHLAVQQGDNGNQVSTMTIHAFITLVKEHDFPFVKHGEKLMLAKRELSDGARMEVAKMVMNLMDQFATREMQDCYLVIEKLYGRFSKDHTKEYIEEKANEWGELMKESRLMSDDMKTKNHRWADEIDYARRSVSFLYQRYMVIWQVGRLERDVLEGVDFPGKGRCREFIKYYMPLDKVNYHTVREFSGNWEDGKPNVYKFLEELIKDESADQKKARAKEDLKRKEATVTDEAEAEAATAAAEAEGAESSVVSPENQEEAGEGEGNEEPPSPTPDR